MKELLYLSVLKLRRVEKKENYVTYEFRQHRGSFLQGWSYFNHEYVVDFVYLFIKYFYLVYSHFGFVTNLVGSKVVVYVYWEDTTFWLFGRRYIKTYFNFTVNEQLKDKTKFIEDSINTMFKNNRSLNQLIPGNRKDDDNLILLKGIKIHIFINKI